MWDYLPISPWQEWCLSPNVLPVRCGGTGSVLEGLAKAVGLDRVGQLGDARGRQGQVSTFLD